MVRYPPLRRSLGITEVACRRRGSCRGVLVSLLLPVYLPAGLSTTAQTLLVPFLPLWLRGRMWSKPLAGPQLASWPAPL